MGSINRRFGRVSWSGSVYLISISPLIIVTCQIPIWLIHIFSSVQKVSMSRSHIYFSVMDAKEVSDTRCRKSVGHMILDF